MKFTKKKNLHSKSGRQGVARVARGRSRQPEQRQNF